MTAFRLFRLFRLFPIWPLLYIPPSLLFESLRMEKEEEQRHGVMKSFMNCYFERRRNEAEQAEQSKTVLTFAPEVL